VSLGISQSQNVQTYCRVKMTSYHISLALLCDNQQHPKQDHQGYQGGGWMSMMNSTLSCCLHTDASFHLFGFQRIWFIVASCCPLLYFLRHHIHHSTVHIFQPNYYYFTSTHIRQCTSGKVNNCALAHKSRFGAIVSCHVPIEV
jgi:hypothetical protein